MDKMSFFKKLGIFALVLGTNGLIQAQGIDLGNPGQQLISALEKWFPVLALIGFFFAGWKAWDSYNESGKEVTAIIKVMAYYVLVLAVFIAIYKYIKGISL